MKTGKEHFKNLDAYSHERHSELSGMLQPFVECTDRYGELLCRASVAIAEVPPSNVQDRVLRDLMANVFDFLFETRRLILEGKVVIAFPLGRRAYESLSLLALCAQDKNVAKRWQRGRIITNDKVRHQLSKQSMPESDKDTQKLYKFFSKAAHPNRSLVPHRYLGEGNSFVFGAIGKPDLVFVTDSCIKNLQMWFWFGAVISYTYRDVLSRRDHLFVRDYFEAAKMAEKVVEWLGKNWEHLLREAQDAIQGDAGRDQV